MRFSLDAEIEECEKSLKKLYSKKLLQPKSVFILNDKEPKIKRNIAETLNVSLNSGERVSSFKKTQTKS